MDHRHLVILSFTCTYSSVFNFEGEAQREPALKLVASLIGQVGMEFILPPNTKDNKVLLMIIHLSCIEVRITLENLPIQKVSDNKFVNSYYLVQYPKFTRMFYL